MPHNGSPYNQFDNEELMKPRTSCKCFFVGSVVTIAIFLTILVIVVPLGVVYGKPSSQTVMTATCLTPECMKLSASISGSLDQTVDPCTDFYKFTCGNWEKNTAIPDDVSSYDDLAILNNLNTKDLAYAISNQLNGTTVEALIKLRNLYFSCMSSNVSNYQTSLMYFLSKIGGWSLIGIIDGTEWSLNGQQFIQEKLLNSPAFFTLNVSSNPTDRTKRSINVINSGLTIPNPLQYSDQTSNLEDFVANVLYTLNPSNGIFYYQEAAIRIVAVERALAMISPTGLTNQTFTVTTLEYLGSLWTDYLWVQQTITLFNELEIKDILPSEQIVLYGEQYFSLLSETLSVFSNQDLEDYAKWQLLYTWMPYLNDELVNLYYEFQRSYNPAAQVSSTRIESCMNFMQKTMPYALGRVFAENLLHNNSKNTTAQMTTNIMKAFRARIGSRTWLDAQTIAVAQNKVDLMLANIAYPDLTFNNVWLNTLYENLSVSANRFQDNVDNYLTNIVPSNLVLLRLPYDLWNTICPTTVNAYYLPMMNNIYILEGIMRSPIFNPEWPLYIQYGKLGYVLGHEITHGFDNTGQRYNATGQLDNLWTQYSYYNFVIRLYCYVQEYSSFSLFGISNNGATTLAENTADNGGLIASYTAYQMAKESNSVTPLLPGLQYTDDQLFFIAFGQVWCSYLTPEAVQYAVSNDNHSPGPIRVAGTVMNSEEFATAFKCPSGSPMNPSKKCSLW